MHDENLPPNLHEGMNPAPAAAPEIDNSAVAGELPLAEDMVAADGSPLAEPTAEVEETVATSEDPQPEPTTEAVQQLAIEQLVLPVISNTDDDASTAQTNESQTTLLIKDDYVAGNLDFSPEGQPNYVALTEMLEHPVADAAEPVTEVVAAGESPVAEPVAEASQPVAEAAQVITVESGLPARTQAPVQIVPAPAGTKQAAATKEAPPPIDPSAAIEAALNPAPQQIGGIEILIQMAEKGEIDAKNIDIIDVTDRFLKAIAAAPKENLRQSGKIIFQASILLRMKAEALLAAKVEDEFGFGDDYVDFDIDGSPIIYDANHQPIARQITLADLERALVRQTKLRQMRHRRVTLEQLIEALRDAERLEAARGDRKVKPRIAIDGYNEMRDMDDILELAHDEDIEDVISRIERLLTSLLEESELLSLLRIIESLGGRGDWVDAFLAVLFLSNAGKISLQQEQFYGPLFIIRAGTEGQTVMVPPAVPESEEPRAH